MAMPVGVASGSTTEEDENAPGGYMDQQLGHLAATPKTQTHPDPKTSVVAPKKEMQVDDDNELKSLTPEEVSQKLREILVTGLLLYISWQIVFFMSQLYCSRINTTAS